MKKTLYPLCLALALALAGCAGQTSSAAGLPTATPDAALTTPEEGAAEATPEEAVPSAYLSGLVEELYQAHPLDLMMLETRAVTDDDPSWLAYQTGLGEEWAGKIDEAVISESMTGSQAYSLVLVKMPSAEDAEAVAQAMLDGIDMGKWVCVRADRARAVTLGEVAVLAMADSSLVDVDALVEQLPAVAGAEIGYDMSAQTTVD